ncbi:phosphatidylinositol transfer protein SFH5 [Microthyrium microscopicum]|uniref:Phosphatidylinositol transfer protein SFH5 n=1 Tax=Microthyrium microscopicum TaxID=703497 RepID=A0A6A6TWD4_9PEZI|nr:phosphatidylinositol transfer protein SFH5 [Microthyrium microscopicum]
MTEPAVVPPTEKHIESGPVVDPQPAAEPPTEEVVPEVEPVKAEPVKVADKAEVLSTPTKSDEPLPTYSGLSWPDLEQDHPLVKFVEALPAILKSADYDEVYGITLKARGDATKADFHTLLILQKFLRANKNELEPAKEQLSKTLVWRKEFQPEKAATATYKKDKFNGLGFITITDGKEAERPQIVTWNVYGAVKDYEKTFVPVEEFLQWRIGLMELGVSKLKLAEATEPIPNYGEGDDPYQGIQVHDYKSVSFLRMDPRAKAASKQTIQMLGDYYPETLSRKFFVNVPLVMQWMFAAMKLFVSAETTKKFTVLSDGVYVKGELGDAVPKEYGGRAGPLEEVGEGMKLE